MKGQAGFVVVLILAISWMSMSNAQVVGLYYWTWSSGSVNVSRTNLDVAFSGEIDPENALSESRSILGKLVGEKYISIGGGDSSGRWTANSLTKLTQYCQQKKFPDYQGVCFDVEEGDSGLASDFAKAFAACKGAGYKVLMTTSNSAPYAISDAASLMRSFIPNQNIDYLSPQLYSSGTENQNDYSTNAGVAYTEWTKAAGKVIPSISYSTLYPDAENVFRSRFGITTAGYMRWDQQR